MSKTDTPANVAPNAQVSLLPITRHDHPEPQTMVWSELELHAIRVYAARCVAAERERWQAEVENLRAGIRELVAASGTPTCGHNVKLSGCEAVRSNAGQARCNRSEKMCECHQIGGRFIAEDPDCPVHGTEAQERDRDRGTDRADLLQQIAELRAELAAMRAEAARQVRA